MSTFTIFNHGTNFHRDKQASEMVSLLSNAMRGDEAIIVKNDDAPLGYSLKTENPNYIICEGPGSDTITGEASESGLEHTWPGNDNPITREKAKEGLMKQQTTLKKKGWFSWSGGKNNPDKEFQKAFYGDTPKPWFGQRGGQISGSGWNDNVYKAVWMLTHLMFGEENQAIDTVNIVGWSRGAVTCLKQAYLLAEVLPQLKVNILAFDPVPGQDPNKHEEDTRTITKNIQTYWGILALNERRMNFRCVDPGVIDNQSPNAWVEHLPMPGNHSDVVRPHENAQPLLRFGEGQDKKYVPKSYKIGLNIAHRFLTYFGTPLKKIDDKPNDPECLTMYNEMFAKRDLIHEEYKACKSWTDETTLRLGWRYENRDIQKKFSKAQEELPQDNYRPYVLRGWINTHHWILAKNDQNRGPNPMLDHPHENVSEDRINKWEKFLSS